MKPAAVPQNAATAFMLTEPSALNPIVALSLLRLSNRQ